jgi:hypothetical protein
MIIGLNLAYKDMIDLIYETLFRRTEKIERETKTLLEVH